MDHLTPQIISELHIRHEKTLSMFEEFEQAQLEVETQDMTKFLNKRCEILEHLAHSSKVDKE